MTDQTKSAKIKRRILFSIILAIIMLASFGGGYLVSCLSQKNPTTNQFLQLLESVSYIVDPETGEVRKFTEEDYINAITNNLLDKYSKYYTAEEYREARSQDQGFYDALGFYTFSNSKKVYKIIGNSPCDIAGVEIEQNLNAAKVEGGEKVIFSDVSEINAFFKQHKQQTNFSLYFDYGDGTDTEYKVTKKSFEASYVIAYDNQTKYCFRTASDNKLQLVQQSSQTKQMLADDTAYIKLIAFEGDAADQFGKVLKKVLDNGKTKIILDLAYNTGGRVDILLDIASYLIYNNASKKSAVFCSEEKTGNKTYNTSQNNFDKRLKNITVIANRYTASASESLIGAMLCYGDSFSKTKDDLVIVGGRTYGKGVMQTTFLLNNGGAIALTSGRLLWPDKSTCIHDKGITVENENNVTSISAGLDRAMAILANK